MRYPSFILLILMPFVCHAAIYKQVGPDGTVTYSDTPLGNNSIEVPAPDVNTVPTKTTQPAQPPAAAAATTTVTTDVTVTQPTRKPYTTFLISSPANQETIQNQPFVTVHIQLDPPLQDGDSIQVYLDGNPWGKPQATTQIAFIAPDRGTHEISAAIVDSRMQVLKSSPTNIIYVHQAHNGT